MTEAENLIASFKALSVEEIQQKLLAIFNFAKDKFDFSETAINYLSSNILPSELVMVNLYEFVVNATMLAKERRSDTDQKQMEKMKSMSQEAELSAQKDSEDADALLDLIQLL